MMRPPNMDDSLASGSSSKLVGASAENRFRGAREYRRQRDADRADSTLANKRRCLCDTRPQGRRMFLISVNKAH